MKSFDLEEKGFTLWFPFTLDSEHALLSRLPNKPGVYVIRRRKTFDRFIGESDLCYIGSSNNIQGIKGRIRQYFHPGPTQRTNKQMLYLLQKRIVFEISFIECSLVREARDLEKRLLLQYDEEDGELPPLNRRE